MLIFQLLNLASESGIFTGQAILTNVVLPQSKGTGRYKHTYTKNE
jgi:hypothetical protein